MPPKAIRQLESELERLAGGPVRLDRPSRAEHGDYATNVALQQAPSQQAVRGIATRPMNVRAIGIEHCSWFISNIGQLGHGRLHPKGHFISLDAGQRFGITQLGGSLTI